MSKAQKLLERAGSRLSDAMQPVSSSPQAAPAPTVANAKAKGLVRDKRAWEIEITQIIRDPNQPRTAFPDEEIERLSHSIKTHGLLEPINVRWSDADSRYIIIAGERRWRACQLAGITSMACIVVEKEMDQGELLSLQLTENCLREDLNPIEQAMAFKEVMDHKGWSQRDTADHLSISQSHVSKTLTLLKLIPRLRERVANKLMSPSAAYDACRLDEDAQNAIADAAEHKETSGASVAPAVAPADDPSPTTSGSVDPPKPAKQSGPVKITMADTAEAAAKQAEGPQSTTVQRYKVGRGEAEIVVRRSNGITNEEAIEAMAIILERNGKVVTEKQSSPLQISA